MTADKQKRILLLFGLLVIGTLLMIRFRLFLWSNLVEPIALLFWAGWKVILSVDQQIYWQLLIWGSVFYFLRFLPTQKERSTAYGEKENGKSIKGLAYWQSMVSSAANDVDKRALLRHDLEKILILGLSNQERMDKEEIKKRLSSHQIECPEFIYAFFYPDQQDEKSFYKKNMQSHYFLPAWLRNLNHREKIQYHHTLSAILQWMEQTLEVPFDPSANP
jgi:hypothetical protein